MSLQKTINQLLLLCGDSASTQFSHVADDMQWRIQDFP